MSRIITGPAGRRYRILKPDWLEQEGFDPDHSTIESTSTWGILLDQGVIEPLPVIPNWPLPMPAPQYLTREEGTPLRTGDIVLGTMGHSHCDWSGTTWNSANGAIAFIRWSMKGFGQNVLANGTYLIARADPEADA